MGSGVIGNTSAFEAEVSRFEPWLPSNTSLFMVFYFSVFCYYNIVNLNKIFLIVAFLLVFLLGIFFGLNIKNKQDDKTPINPEPSSGSASCEYNGKSYQSGEGFPSADGCNSCSCEDGKVVCTLMACE